MTANLSRLARLMAAVSTAALLSACAVTPTPFTQDEFSAKAKADRSAMFEGQEVMTKPLTLADAVARGVPVTNRNAVLIYDNIARKLVKRRIILATVQKNLRAVKRLLLIGGLIVL